MTAQAWILLGMWLLTLAAAVLNELAWAHRYADALREAFALHHRWRLVAEITALRAAKQAALGEQTWSIEDQIHLSASIQALKDTGVTLAELGIEDEPPPQRKPSEVQ